MKKKVAFVNFWDTFKPQDSLFYKILCKHFEIDLVDWAQAEYVFYSVWGDDHLYVPDNAVKIYFTGENRTPNFNECDYAMGFERLSFRDRYMRFPLYYIYPECQLLENKHIGVGKSTFDAKKGFCSFTVSNETCQPRNEMFYLLSSYKRVDLGGKYPEMQSFGYPVVLDVTHSLQQPNQTSGVTGGMPRLIETIAKAGIAVDVDGLFIETHENPVEAKSDGANMLRLDLIEELLVNLVRVHKAVYSTR